MNSTDINKARMEAYTKKHINDTAFAITDEWDESKHPRAANGQFGSGGANSAPTKATKVPTKGNTTPTAKKPAQTAARPKYWESVTNVVNESLMQWSYHPTQKAKSDPTIVASKYAQECMENGSTAKVTKKVDNDGKIHAFVKLDNTYKFEINWDPSQKRFVAKYVD